MNIKNISFPLMLALLFCSETSTMTTAGQRALLASRTIPSRLPAHQAPSTSRATGRSYSSLRETPQQKTTNCSTSGYQKSFAQSWAKLRSFFPDKPNQATTDLVVKSLKSGSKEDLLKLFDKGIITSNSRYDVKPSLFKSKDVTILHLAAREKASPEIMALLLDKGANVQARNKDGHTPLDIAVRYNNLEAVKFLVANGANPNALDKRFSLVPSFLQFEPGRTPLYVAQEEDRPSENTSKIIELLEPLTKKSLGFKVTPKVALKRAILSKQVENVKQALATKKLSKKELSSALIDTAYTAASSDNPTFPAQVAQLLIQAGANVNAQASFTKTTPLHAAAENHKPQLVEFFLAKEADPIARNSEGKTPLDLTHSEDSIRKILRKYFTPSACQLEQESQEKLKVIDLLAPAQNRAYEIDRTIRDSQ